MKNEKLRKGLITVSTILDTALCCYSVYSAYYTLAKDSIKPADLALYTALTAISIAIIMLLYVFTDRKKTHSVTEKIIVPIISLIVSAGAYLGALYGLRNSISPSIASHFAAGVSLVLFGIGFAVYLNGLSFDRQKALKTFYKITAAVLSVVFMCTGVFIGAKSMKGQSYLKWLYPITSESKNIGGLPTGDNDIFYDFSYATEKYVRNTALGTDDSIDIKLAKNESEGFQISFATAASHKKVNISVTDFKNSDGDALETRAYSEYYLEVKGYGNIYNCEYPDPLIPVKSNDDDGAIELKKGLRQDFYIRTHADKDAKPGEYTATLTAVNENNETILEKEIKATVWDFSLPETPANDTAFGNIVYRSIYYELSGIDANDEEAKQELNLKIYDILLENRLSPYNIPYDILDDRADAYMSDPRLKSFMIPYPDNDELLVKYYEKVTSNPEWAKKAYFYPVDEPGDSAAYQRYAECVERLNRLCPGYNMVTPFNKAKVNIEGTDVSSVALQAGKSSILCGLSNVVNEGSIHDEMMNEAANGSRAWWYVCCSPTGDYCNFFDYQDALRHRMLMWQQKSLDLTGLLYWSAVYSINNPWEHANAWGNFDSAGDGILIYPGAYVGVDEPVISLRLVNIADGMEDYDYFALAQEKYGEEWVDDQIAKVTSSPTEFTSDHACFEQTRRDMAEAIIPKA